MKGWVALSNLLKVVEHKSQKASEASLLSKCSLQVKISDQNVSYCTCKRPCFHRFPTVPNRFKYHKNACFRYIIVFNYFSEVLNRFKYLHNACFRCTLFSSISMQFQIVSDSTRMHTLERLFSSFSLQFQIVSDTTRMHALETLFHYFLCSFK